MVIYSIYVSFEYQITVTENGNKIIQKNYFYFSLLIQFHNLFKTYPQKGNVQYYN